MATKQTWLRLPTGILEAIDARRDADNDRTTIIISLLTSALTGEYIKPKENTTQIIGKLTKTVKSLEASIDELSFQIKKQTRINDQTEVHPISESRIVSERNNFVTEDTTDFDDDEDLAIEQVISDDGDFSDEDDDWDEDIEDKDSDCVEDIEPEVEPEPTKLNHQEFIDRFESSQPSGWDVYFIDGSRANLQTVSRDAIRVIFPNGASKMRMASEIDYYQLSA